MVPEMFRNLHKPRFFKKFYEKKAFEEDHQSLVYEKGIDGDLWGLWWHQARMFRIMKLLLSTSGSFLEVGCAEGLYVRFYFDTHRDNQFVVGLDIARNFIEKARKRCSSAMWVVGDAQNLPFKENSFDVVLCSEVLEHLIHPKSCFSQLPYISKKHILVTVPGGHSPFFYTARKLKLLNFFKRSRAYKERKNMVWNPSSGHISLIEIEDLIEWSREEKLHISFLQERVDYFSESIALKYPAFFIPVVKILDSIISKIPQIRKYGLSNILLAERF